MKRASGMGQQGRGDMSEAVIRCDRTQGSKADPRNTRERKKGEMAVVGDAFFDLANPPSKTCPLAESRPDSARQGEEIRSITERRRRRRRDPRYVNVL